MEQSRWFIKEKPLQEQIKACQRSLEAARRSGRANIVKALGEKLAKLQGQEPKDQSGLPKAQPAKEAGSKKVATAKRKGKRSKRREEAAEEAAEEAEDATGGRDNKQKGPEERAVGVLLRAAAKAKAARRAMGEESEEEAPLPELLQNTSRAVQDGQSEQSEHEDEDFFVLGQGEQAPPSQTARSLRGDARRAKRLRRLNRLESLRVREKHPSWVASQSPRVSGAISKISGKRTVFHE